jgi:hypothetical protein
MYCSNCGLAGEPNKTCHRCGSLIGAPAGSARAAYEPMRPAVETPTLRESRSVLILVFGILSIVVIGLFGPFAWAIGRSELKLIDSGGLPREGRGMALAGMICGIVGTAILTLQALMVVWMISMWP